MKKISTAALFISILGLTLLLLSIPRTYAETHTTGPEIAREEYAVPALGNFWRYRCLEDKDTITHRVTGKQELDGLEAYKYEILFGESLVNIRYAARDQENVVLLLEQDPISEKLIAFTPPRISMKLPLTPGDSWSSEFQDYSGGHKIETYTVERRETVKVPAGTFDTYFINVTIVDKDNLEPPAAVKVWYAPEVGMVKQVVQTDLSRYTMVLEEYTIKETVKISGTMH